MAHTDGMRPLTSVDSLRALADQLFTGVVSDVLDSLGRPAQVMAPGLVPLDRSATIIGRARPMRAEPTLGIPERPYSRLLEAIDAIGSGDVLVCSSGGRQSSGLFGGLLATAVLAAGAHGAVIDGMVRDSNELLRLGLPTFCAGTSPVDSLGRDDLVSFDEPLDCRGVHIVPGDLLVADVDGVVVVPATLEVEVIEQALEKIRGEGRMRTDLAAGMSATEAFARHGIL